MRDIFQNRRLDLIPQLFSMIYFKKYFKKYSPYVILVCLHLYYIVPEPAILVRGPNYSLPLGHILPLDVIRNKDSDHHKAYEHN